MEMFELKIKLDFEVNSLYDIGYLSIDIYQLIVFCELIEEYNSNYALEVFKSKSFNRYNSILKNYREKVKINHVNDGSIEIYIEKIGQLATLVLPFLSSFISDKIKKSNELIKFEIETNDSELQEIFAELKKGYYGKKEDDWFDWLQSLLIEEGYSVEIVGKDCYRVIKKYGKRIIKTIPKNIK